MQRVTRSSAVAAMPPRPASPASPGWFTQGNPASGIPATVPGYEWFNGVQAELIALIERSGLAPDPDTLDQVRRSLDRLHGGGVTTVSANVTLTPDSAGLVLVDASGGARTITLPATNAANGRPIQFRFVRLDATANAVTIQRAGSDTFRGGATSVTMPRSSALLLASDGASVWDTLGEHTRGRSMGANGWTTLPGGVILQWGEATLPNSGINSTTVAVVFPVAFPVAVRSVQAITLAPANSPNGTHLIPTAQGITLTGFNLATSNNSSTIFVNQTIPARWMAIGE